MDSPKKEFYILGAVLLLVTLLLGVASYFSDYLFNY